MIVGLRLSDVQKIGRGTKDCLSIIRHSVKGWDSCAKAVACVIEFAACVSRSVAHISRSVACQSRPVACVS